MASDETEASSGVHVIQLVETNGGRESPSTSVEEEAPTEGEISPLLPDAQGRPRMSIFSVSNPSNRNGPSKEFTLGEVEREASSFFQFFIWLWGRSKYSGLLCIGSSSAIYCTMEFFTDTFSGRSVPLFEVIFVRCAVISILSLLWIKSTGRPIFGPRNARNLLLLRSLTGFLSLLCFVYSVQNLPLPYAMILNFSTPLLATVAARTILKEKMTLIDIGGLVCGFLGLLFIFQPKFLVQGELAENGDEIAIEGSHVFPIVVGVLSTIASGISYCLIKAAAKASDQPVSTVLAFGIFAGPLSAICAFSFQEFVMMDPFTLILTIVLGILAFFAEVSLARGLQLEKISKATMFQYLKVLLSQIRVSSQMPPSFTRLVGCLLILASICSTMYSGADRGTDMDS